MWLVSFGSPLLKSAFGMKAQVSLPASAVIESSNACTMPSLPPT